MGNWDMSLMAVANLLPFCSRATFCAVGVLELKNFSQFALIWAAAPELVVLPELAVVPELAVGVDVVEVDDELLELLQAATAAASARPSAGARMIRRATCWNRMTRLLSLGRIYD
jgi:hypothetical protein